MDHSGDHPIPACSNLQGVLEHCDRKKPTLTWKESWPQVYAACSALSLPIQSGISISFSAILIPQLADDPNFTNFGVTQASWVASIVALSTPIGALIAGPLMDLIGRKKTCIVTAISFMISWLLTYFINNSLTMLYISRFLVGLNSGMTTVGVVYTSEISNYSLRPVLLSLNSVFFSLGIFFTTAAGAALPWRLAVVGFGLTAFTSFLLCCAMPESPYWLLHFHRDDETVQKAKESLKWLNRPHWLFREEWANLRSEIPVQVSVVKSSLWEKTKLCYQKFTTRACLAPFFILTVMFLFQQLTGVYVIIFYAVNIFRTIGNDFGLGIDEYNATMILGLLRFIMSLVAAFLCRKYGRRSLMIASSIGIVLSCLGVSGIQFNYGSLKPEFISRSTTNISTILQETGSEERIVQGISLLCILTYVCFASIGYLNIPWTLIGELLPSNIRAVGSGILVSYAYIILFLFVKTFPFVLENTSIGFIFLMYSAAACLSGIHIYFCLPETFGKTLPEIAQVFVQEKQ